MPVASHTAISSGVELLIQKELQELAESYRQRYFAGDFLNGLIKNGTLGCLFTNDYFNCSKRDESLMLLLAKGTDLSQLLVRISEAIRALLKPYMAHEPKAGVSSRLWQAEPERGKKDGKKDRRKKDRTPINF